MQLSLNAKCLSFRDNGHFVPKFDVFVPKFYVAGHVFGRNFGKKTNIIKDKRHEIAF